MSDESVAKLVAAARAVREQAYAPYSQFRVGAALETTSGEVFVGCNVENSSFGLTVCAERCALGAAVAAGHRQFKRVAVVAESKASPCGACRQMLAEFGDFEVIMADPEGRITHTRRLAELLPDQFKLPAR
jgi:cytidine deaminase